MKSLKSSSYQLGGSNSVNANNRRANCLASSYSTTSINVNNGVSSADTLSKAVKSNNTQPNDKSSSLSTTSEKRGDGGSDGRCSGSLESGSESSNKFTSLKKDFDYFELLEFLTEKSKNLKQENRKLFISKIINLLTSAEKITNENNNENDLEKKLDEMRAEIGCLKQQLSSSSSQQQQPPSIPVYNHDDQEENNNQQQQQQPLNPNDLNGALNLIISNYFEKLTKMQQQIDELNNLNKCLFYIEKNVNYEQNVTSGQHQANESNVFCSHNHAAACSRNETMLVRLEHELQTANDKIQQLTKALEDKNKQSEQYIFLFRYCI
jgi:hypothetical protein